MMQSASIRANSAKVLDCVTQLFHYLLYCTLIMPSQWRQKRPFLLFVFACLCKESLNISANIRI